MTPLYLDEDSERKGLVRALRQAGLDVVTATEMGTRSWPDSRQLEFAREAGRVIYTCNQSDFVRLHWRLLTINGHHAGIIVLTHQRLGIGSQARGLIRLLSDSSPNEWANRLEFVENHV